MRHPAEKHGNTTWVQCPGCRGWFHASAALLAARAVPLHCPHCQREFAAEQAAQVIPAAPG